MITRKDWQDGWRSGHEAMNGKYEPLTVDDTAMPTLPPYEHYIAESKKLRRVVIWAGELTVRDKTWQGKAIGLLA